MNEDETIYKMMEAAAIVEGLRLLIERLQQSEQYQHDDSYKSLLAFISDIHWRFYKVQTSHKLTQDLFGRLHLKDDDKQQSINLN